jgi:BirA family biotin operon repressor/biotin-[acetyl-CoA-carboxylase] ligase
MITLEDIRAGLAGSHEFAIDIVDECASTNALLLERAEAGAPGGSVLVARRQTAGRGRLGRQWISAPGDSLTFSLLWRFAPGTVPLGLSLAVGVAVARAVAKVGADEPTKQQGGRAKDALLAVANGSTASPVVPRLKWPNDVLLDGRKLAGILIELVPGVPNAAVIGIGVNLRLPAAMPDDVREIAAALPDGVRGGQLLGVLLTELDAICRLFAAGGFAAVRDDWLVLHAYQDSEISVLSDNAPALHGLCLGVDQTGALLLDAEGHLHTVMAGDVSVRLQ